MHLTGLRFALLLTFAALAAGLYPGSARAQTPPSCIPGAGNCATVDQGGDLQVATVAQAGGTGNAADIDQVGQGPIGGNPPPPFPPDGNVRSNWVDLVQVGSGNQATISQGPDGGAWADWGSYQNCVYLNQADGSIADVRQEGSYNRVWGTGSAYNAPEHGDSFDSTLLVLQTGFANELYFDQQGSTAVATQTGERNTAHVTQQ